MRSAMQVSRTKCPYDVVIVGAGPAGLSAGFEAKRRGLRCLILEKARIASTINEYPLGKTIFSDARDVELEPNTFGNEEPTRESILRYYQKFSERVLANEIREQTPVLRVEKREDIFFVSTPSGVFVAPNVIVAVGGVGIVNRVNVPGEDEAGLSYHYQEIQLHKDKRVLVLGGGNSAAEAVCDLHQEGAKVTWIVRRPSLDLTVASRATPIHPSVRKPVESLYYQQQITIMFGARVLSFSGKRALVEVGGERHDIAYDSGFALLGRLPDQQLIRTAGAECDAEGFPIYHVRSGETSVSGLFVVGHCTREINLINAITRPRLAVEEIANRLECQPAVLAPETSVELASGSTFDPPARNSDLSWVLTDPGAIAVGLANFEAEQSLSYASADGNMFYEQLMIQNSAVIRAKLNAMTKLGLRDDFIEDIVITTDNQLHVFRVLPSDVHEFLIMILDRKHANLALARYRLKQIEEQLGH